MIPLTHGRRELRRGEVKILATALTLSVAVVMAILVFVDQLGQAIESSATRFLAADRQLSSTRPVDPAWLADAQGMGLSTGRILSFPSMLVAGEQMQLASVKAVSPEYPLRGSLDVSGSGAGVVAGEAEQVVSLQTGPSPGEVWVAERLLPLLNVQVGDTVTLGYASLVVGRVLLREPDAGFSFADIAPRVLMAEADLAGAGLVRPGSRVQYTYLFAGDDAALTRFGEAIQPRLVAGQRWIGVREGRPAIAASLDRAEQFLLLGGSLAILLSAIAIAIAASRYASVQQDTVALLKTLGLSQSGMMLGLVRQLLALWLLASGVGSLLGLALGWGLSQVLAQWTGQAVSMHLTWVALWPAPATGLICLTLFVLPPLWALRHVAPMRILRSQRGAAFHITPVAMALAGLGFAVLLLMYTRSLSLSLAVIGGVAVLGVVLGFAGWGMVALVASLSTGAGSPWRLALASLRRHPTGTMTQVFAFALAIGLSMMLFLTRTSLLNDWQAQLPDGTPNHFLINVAPKDVPRLQSFLSEHGVATPTLYPMVRGRLSHLNGEDVKTAVSKEEEVNALNRELNLTWASTLPTDNRVLEGQWWDAVPQQAAVRGVSVESKLAERMGLKLGDQLRFMIGAEPLEVTVSSIRSVKWDSMRPNFYMIFPPSALDAYPATWITSIYLAPTQTALLKPLAQQFPTVTVLAVDQFINRIRDMTRQVSLAVESILLMVLGGAMLVMLALVESSLSRRQREHAVLRALGASDRLLRGSLRWEFGLMGGVAGALGMLVAEVMVMAVQLKVFDGDISLHPQFWLLGPALGIVATLSLSHWQTRRLPYTSAMSLLRES